MSLIEKISFNKNPLNLLSRQNRLYFEFPKIRKKKREIKIQGNPQNRNLTSKVMQN